MSKGKRYTEEFKIEAVKQVTERDYSAQEVAERLGITAKSLYNWRSPVALESKIGQGVGQQTVTRYASITCHTTPIGLDIEY